MVYRDCCGFISDFRDDKTAREEHYHQLEEELPELKGDKPVLKQKIVN